MQATSEQHWACVWLALGLAAAALFGMGPACYDLWECWRAPESAQLARWAFALFALSVVQLGVCALVWQAPDWSSVLTSLVAALAGAGLYAMTAGAALISSPHGWFMHALHLTDEAASGRVLLWSVCMACVYATYAFFAAKRYVDWRHHDLEARERQRAEAVAG